jgi:class 3 adenylate cyclase
VSDVDVNNLPVDPILRQVAAVLEDASQYASIYDSNWHLVYVSDAQKEAGRDRLLGRHVLSYETELVLNVTDQNRSFLLGLGGFVLADTPGGKEELKTLVHPKVKALVDEMVPNHALALANDVTGSGTGEFERHVTRVTLTTMRLRDENGKFIGAVTTSKPTGSAYMIAAMTSTLSPLAMEGMRASLWAARRPAAILCADLDGSAPLSRRLSTPNYFNLIRSLVYEVDRCVIGAGGLVGRHAGDGVTAFFLVDTLGSESRAARACVTAARMIRDGAREVAQSLDQNPAELVMRFGLHWGANLYVGAVLTEGRFEVTALGDQVNEAARIEACASGGHALASKELLERLTNDDASELDLELDHVLYTALGDLSTATEKARRDAPAIAVCEI